MKEKEEIIKEAYGKYWDGLSIHAKKCALNNNGYIAPIISGLGEMPMDFVVYNDLGFRPKSIIGIENNNGWVRIYRESDLPKFDCDCYWIDRNDGLILGRFVLDGDIEFIMRNATHYKIIEEPKMPIY